MKGKVAFLPADIDRRFARDGFPDHGVLMANLIRWGAGGNFPLEVTGPGLVDCSLYTQPKRLVLHAVSLSGSATRGAMEELIPVGPFTIRLRLTSGITGRSARFLVSGGTAKTEIAQGWATFHITSIRDHEVIVVE